MTRRPCSVESCDKPVHGRNLCGTHYWRWQKHGSPHEGGRLSLAERLATKVSREGNCLIYQSKRKTRSGHLQIGDGGRVVLVHRAAWELVNGPIPDGLFVLHRCDRPRCVNVNHLFLGTIADNNADRDRKGRHVALKGSSNGTAKLDEAAVAQIKKRLADGESTRAVAQAFSVSQTTVWLIKAGRTWSHVRPAKALAGCQWPDREQVTAR